MANIYAYATEITLAKLEGRAPNMSRVNHNKKPYRTKAQKAEARNRAHKCDDGAWRCNVPVSYHPAPKGVA